jgi:hypothetical protein
MPSTAGLDHGRRLPANGVVAVRARNRGSLVEDRYGFKPEQNLEYYTIVLPARREWRWRFEELDTTPGAAGTQLRYRDVQAMQSSVPAGPVNRANFYTCATRRRTTRADVEPDDVRQPRPVWIDCAAGAVADPGERDAGMGR